MDDEMIVIEFIVLPIMLLMLSGISYKLTSWVIKKKYGNIKFRIYLKNFPNKIDKKKTIVTFIIVTMLTLLPQILENNFHWYYIFTPILIMIFLLIRTFSYNPYDMRKVDDEFEKLSDVYIQTEERNDVINKLLK